MYLHTIYFSRIFISSYAGGRGWMIDYSTKALKVRTECRFYSLLKQKQHLKSAEYKRSSPRYLTVTGRGALPGICFSALSLTGSLHHNNQLKQNKNRVKTDNDIQRPNLERQQYLILLIAGPPLTASLNTYLGWRADPH